MVKQLLFPIAVLLVFASTSCSKDPVEVVLKTPSTITKPIKPVTEPEINEPITESEKTSNWISQMQGPNGLLKSTEYIDFVSLYDNSLAAIWHASQGDLANTEKILDFFDGKVQTELLANTGGFYQFRDSNGQNGSRTWMGDNAWLLIAINHYHEASGNQKYQNMALELELWLRSLQNADGSLSGGLNEDGTEIPKVTEGMITAFSAVEGYDDFHKGILGFIKYERWVEEEEILLAWPENLDYKNALDVHSLSFMIFEDFPKATLTKTEMYLNTQELTLSGEEITGYCFDQDKDVVWLEGTAQMALAFELDGNQSQTQALLTDIEKTFITSSTLTESKGIPYTTNFGTTYGNGQLWDHADITPALSSTIWYLFAKSSINPFELGRNKNIPLEDKFW